jgi:hypothetical protein
MIVKLLVIVVVAFVVFWLAGRVMPKLSSNFKTRILPILLSPAMLPLIKRIGMLLLRILFRR